MRLNLPYLSHLPPRVLRLGVGFVGVFVLILTSGILLVQWRSASTTIRERPSTSTNSTTDAPVKQPTFYPPLGQIPWWTTEQEGPRFAYAQYATNIDYLCNSVINFAKLRRYGAKHDLVLIFPTQWSEGSSEEAKAIANIREKLPEVHLRPFDVISTSKGDSTWRDSLTKFHSFALTEWTRVLAFDSDSLVLNNMDHYFLSPLAPIAVPRAYWLNEKNTDIAKQVLGSHVMLLEPNERRYHKIIEEAQRSGEFDMEVLNHMFKDSAMILPHRRLALLTGEFRNKDHSKYLAPDEDEEWNAMGEVSRSFLVHFSDWPLPKPWKHRTKEQFESIMPECSEDDLGAEDRPPCADRMMWTGFYTDYDEAKEHYCSVLHD